MPTDMQIEWLKEVLSGEFRKQDDPHKYSVYMRRIRDRLDREIKSIKWIANYYPEILTDEEYEIQNYGRLRHMRLIALMEIIKAIMPEADPVLVKMKKDIGMQ